MWFLRRRPEPESSPASLEALLRLADVARDSGDAATAARHYEAVLAQSPDRLDVKIQLGNMLKDSGQLRQADAIYKEAQTIAPDDPDISIQRGRVRKLMGDRAGALALFRQAAALSQDSFDAVEELSSLGASDVQQRRYEVHLRAGGSEAIMQMSLQLKAMRALLDDMAERLPDALGQTAIPLESYTLFRELHTVPPPPSGPREAVTALLLIDRETEPTLEVQLSGFAGQTARDWTVLAIGQDPARRAVVARAGASDPRIRLLPAEAGEAAAAAAEWQVARTVEAGWLLVLAQGAILHRQALAWAASLPALGGADAYVFDEDRGRLEEGRLVPQTPVFRAAVDYDTLLEANAAGETVLVGAETYRRLLGQAPEGSVGRARSRLLLELAARGRVGHLPHPLVTRLDPVRLSVPEHRLAIGDHIAAQGFADRLAVAKGETGPSVWRPRAPERTIAVVIATADRPHGLRRFVAELRERSAGPDHVRIVLVDTGSTEPDTRAALEELGAKGFVTRVTEPLPFGRAHFNTLGAQATDAPLLVFAHDDQHMMTGGWDEHVRGHLERDETGALGCRILYPDDTLAHAGILFGWRGRTISDGLFEAAEAPGPSGRFQLTRAVSAVSDAFLAITRDRFLAAGGFDAAGLPDHDADVDLCLRLRQDGRRILYTPAITLRTDTAKSEAMDALIPERMGRFAAARTLLHARWGEALQADAGLNPVWYPATMPFRLLSAPSEVIVLRHLQRTAAANPWAVEPAPSR